MILFPNCKINLGLNVIGKRPDGYHDIETLMIPINWHDILEIVPSDSDKTELFTSGRTVDCPPEKNLVVKAWHAMNQAVGGELPPVKIYLEKIIPDGAGLGGGSSDAAFMLKGLNELFSLGFPQEKLAEIASTLGADCPYFIYNVPCMATGTGTQLSPIAFSKLNNMKIVLAKPQCSSVSTAEAYRGVMNGIDTSVRKPILDIIDTDIDQWQGVLKNDFENTVIPLAKEIGVIKDTLIKAGGVYASMSGSGAAVYGFFENDKLAERAAAMLGGCDIFVDNIHL